MLFSKYKYLTYGYRLKYPENINAVRVVVYIRGKEQITDSSMLQIRGRAIWLPEGILYTTKQRAFETGGTSKKYTISKDWGITICFLIKQKKTFW